MKRRLLYVTRNPLDHAPYAEMTLPALARAGWEIHKAAPEVDRSILNQLFPYPHTKIDLPPTHQSLKHEAALAKLMLSARFRDMDVLYIHGPSICWRAGIALAGPLGRFRLVYHNPDFYDPLQHPLYAYLEGRICRKSHLHINNEYHRGYITATFYQSRSIGVVSPPNLSKAWPIPARDPALRDRLTGGQQDAFVLIVHGGYSPLRMTQQLFEAIALLDKRYRLVMTGGGGRPDAVDQKLIDLGIQDRVVRIGKPDFQDLLAHTVNCDAGILLYESSLGNFFTAPGRLTEYLSCGLPVLGSAYTGLERVVYGFKIGTCADGYDPKDLAEAIKRLRAGKEAGKYEAGAMRQQFENHFAYEHWEPLVVEGFERMMTPEGGKKNHLWPRPWWPGPPAFRD